MKFLKLLFKQPPTYLAILAMLVTGYFFHTLNFTSFVLSLCLFSSLILNSFLMMLAVVSHGYILELEKFAGLKRK